MAGVFRFANAVSDIRGLIETYKVIYNELNNSPNFTHDDATDALIQNGLVSSSGAIGKEALRRSRRDDRSRDPLYNQLKMYSEIYRMLGWYTPGTKRTNFNIPAYGEYIYDSKNELLQNHFELNILHIVSPNPFIEIRGKNILRPFPLIIKLLNNLGGIIHRDEIILAVLACENDRQENYIDDAVERILTIRGDLTRLETAYEYLMERNGVNSKDVYRNYTRFILATLKWLNYAIPVRIKGVYGNKSVVMYKQSDYGKEKAIEIEDRQDIRNEELSNFTLEERSAFTIYSIYHHLGKLGYDLTDKDSKDSINLVTDLSRKILDVFDISPEKDFLYFGYQESTPEEIEYCDTIIP